MIGYAISKNGAKIRIPEERWLHITDSHDYMAGLSDNVLDCIENPEVIIKGERDELIAAQRFNNKHIVVIYREVSDEDGFVITSFVTSDVDRILKDREIKWKKK